MIRRLVLDASAAMRLVLRESGSAPLQSALEDATMVLVPSIFFSEVANGLWKYATISGELTAEQCVVSPRFSRLWAFFRSA